MFKVYWMSATDEPCCKDFNNMVEALNYTQDLRNTYQRRFVTMVSENPDCTSLTGVAETGTDYNWKKRRI